MYIRGQKLLLGTHHRLKTAPHHSQKVIKWNLAYWKLELSSKTKWLQQEGRGASQQTDGPSCWGFIKLDGNTGLLLHSTCTDCTAPEYSLLNVTHTIWNLFASLSRFNLRQYKCLFIFYDVQYVEWKILCCERYVKGQDLSFPRASIFCCIFLVKRKQIHF